MIQHICFDVDNTLLDFHAGEKVAFFETMATSGLLTTQEVYEQYREINEEMWRALERGEITKQKLKIQRFVDFLEATHQEYDAYLLKDLYENNLATQAQFMDGAEAFIHEITTRMGCSVATNGITHIQLGRLKKAGIIDCFQHLFISEAMHCQKPEKEYFDQVLQTLGCKASELLFVGDSLTADIAGANDAGCISVWFNPLHIENKSEVQPMYEIDDLKEVFQLVEEIK